MVKKKEDVKKLKSNKKSIIKEITHPNILPSTLGERASDKLTQIAGSWVFIICFLVFLFIWMIINAVWLIERSWDPYPFILLNLVLSCLAAIQAPIILMSQNRQAQKDRQRAEYDYAVNRKAERGIQDLRKQLDRIERKIK
jgi:uncharacterized membrane protein